MRYPSGRPARETPGPAGASVQRTSPSRVERGQLVRRAWRRRSGRAATRTPRVGAEPALRAVLAHDPGAARGAATSSRPGAGSEKSAGCACSTPTASRSESSTARPGGLSDARRATATRPRPRAPPQRAARPRRQARARRRPRRTTSHDRSCASSSPGTGSRSRAQPLTAPLLQQRRERVEAAAQARVDRAARQVEQLGDLARRVLEQVAQHDHPRCSGGSSRERAHDARARTARRPRRPATSAQLDLGAQRARAAPSRSRG